MFGRAFCFFPLILQYNHNVDHMERKVENFKNFNKIPLYICTEFLFYFLSPSGENLAPEKKTWWSFRLLFFKLINLIIHGFANIFEGRL